MAMVASLVSGRSFKGDCVAVGSSNGRREGDYYKSDVQFAQQVASEIREYMLNEGPDDSPLPSDVSMKIHARFFVRQDEQEGQGAEMQKTIMASEMWIGYGGALEDQIYNDILFMSEGFEKNTKF